MNKYINQTACGLFASLIIFSDASTGGEVYKWIDVDGATHYGEIPPESDLASVELLELNVVDPSQSASPGYQSILDVANSLAASRMERERLRLEKKKLQLQEEEARRPQPVQKEVYYGAAVGRYYYPPRVRHYKRPLHGDRHPRPEHARGRGMQPRGDHTAMNPPEYLKRK